MGRDLDELRRALGEWARAKLGTSAIERIEPAQGGASSETYLVDATLHAEPVQWVLRVEPRGHQVYEDPSVVRQFAVISALAAEPGLPIPAPIALETDEAVLGAPFFVMERAAGAAPPNDYHRTGLLAAAAACERETLWREGVELLARLHAVPLEPLAFLSFANGGDGIVQELGRWDQYRDWIEVPDLPVYAASRAWLERHRPAEGAPGFAWGDARLPNMMFAGGRVSALLDWETASLGGAQSDLGWWWFYDRMITETEGVPRLDGIGDGAATVACWEQFSGTTARDVEWHLIFAGYRFALISERARALAIAAGRLPPDQWGPANPAVRLLERLLDEHDG